jgi:hypothetical protein
MQIKKLAQITDKQGFSLITVVILIAIMFSQISFLVRNYIIHTQNIDLQYKIAKTHYLAVSGLAIAKDNFDFIPVISENYSKQAIYNSLGSAFLYNNAVEGQLFLLKTDSIIYSAGILNNKYRCLIKIFYQNKNNKLEFAGWEKF